MVLATVASLLVCADFATTVAAANPIRLEVDQGSGFAVLGHSCGGIREAVYVRGFAANGYPQGNVGLETKCGGSGHTTTYTATASVVWTWFGETRSHSKPGGPLEAQEATDTYGDRVYNEGPAAYLETGNPPLQAPAAPTNVRANVFLSDEPPEDLRMNVAWTVAQETARLLKYSTVTATPVNSTAPVLTAQPSSYFSSAVLDPVEPSTTYNITVTSTDSEGTSAPSAPIELTSPNSDGEAKKALSCPVNQGTLRLSPGLTEEPAIQSITVTGEMSACEGPIGVESGKYTAHLVSNEEVTCSALSSAAHAGSRSTSVSVKWVPTTEGSSRGSLVLPLSEAPTTGMTGTLSGGPFATPANIKARSLSESFTGAATCGQPQGKRKTVKPVTTGAFSTSALELG